MDGNLAYFTLTDFSTSGKEHDKSNMKRHKHFICEYITAYSLVIPARFLSLIHLIFATKTKEEETEQKHNSPPPHILPKICY